MGRHMYAQRLLQSQHLKQDINKKISKHENSPSSYGERLLEITVLHELLPQEHLQEYSSDYSFLSRSVAREAGTCVSDFQ